MQLPPCPLAWLWANVALRGVVQFLPSVKNCLLEGWGRFIFKKPKTYRTQKVGDCKTNNPYPEVCKPGTITRGRGCFVELTVSPVVHSQGTASWVLTHASVGSCTHKPHKVAGWPDYAGLESVLFCCGCYLERTEDRRLFMSPQEKPDKIKCRLTTLGRQQPSSCCSLSAGLDKQSLLT